MKSEDVTNQFSNVIVVANFRYRVFFVLGGKLQIYLVGGFNPSEKY